MKKTFLALLIFSAVGLVASIVMTRMHFELEKGGFEEKSFCNISETVDCDTVLASRYAKVFGIPTAQLGLLYYLFFFLASLYAWGSEKERGRILAFLFPASVGALLYSIGMAFISFVHLQTVCLLCLTTYVANLAIVFLVPRAQGLGLRALFHWPLVVFLIFVAGGLLVFKGFQEKQPPRFPISREEYLKLFYAAKPVPFELAGRPVWGNPEGRVTIVEFSDFQCPYCRRAAFTLKPYLGEFKKDVRLFFVHYPLDNACNKSITRLFHPVSCLAAKAAECAHQKGKFWEFHDEVFQHQKKISRETLMKIAAKTGLDPEWFNVCLISGEVEASVAEDIGEGDKFGVHGTPALFINGRPLPDWTDPERLRWVVQAERLAGR